MLQKLTPALKTVFLNRKNKPEKHSTVPYEGIVITDLKDIDVFSQILSKPNGEIHLADDELRNHVVVIRIIGSINEAAIFAARSFLEEQPLLYRQTIFDIKNQLAILGLRTTIKIAESNVIELIYKLGQSEDSTFNVSDTSKKEEEVDKIVRAAVEANASDIHFEISGEDAIIRFRVDGLMSRFTAMTASRANDLCSVMYTTMATEKETHFNPKQPQAARIERTINLNKIVLRLNTLPTNTGLDVTLRVSVLKNQSNFTLESAGFSHQAASAIRIAIEKKSGAIFLAGETGSGKTTTINMLLREVNTEGNKVITIEDPVELLLPNATQVSVVHSENDKDDGNIYEKYLKASLRMDPNILAIGEIRTKDTAQLMVDAVLSGHQCYSTVHASSAFGVIGRLNEIGVKLSILGAKEFFSCIIFQKLIPRVCKYCGLSVEQLNEKPTVYHNELSLLKRAQSLFNDVLPVLRFKNHDGCSYCNKSGIKGRIVISELIKPDDGFITLVSSGQLNEARKHVYNQNYLTVLEDAILKSRLGLVSPLSIEEHFARIEPEEIRFDLLTHHENDLPIEAFSITEDPVNKESSLALNPEKLWEFDLLTHHENNITEDEHDDILSSILENHKQNNVVNISRPPQNEDV